MVDNMVRRNDKFHIFILHLLILSERNASRQVHISIKVHNMDNKISNISHLVVMGKSYTILRQSLSFLNVDFNT